MELCLCVIDRYLLRPKLRDIYPLFASVGFHVKIPIFTVTFVEIIYHYCISIEHFLPPNLQSVDEWPLELPFSAEPRQCDNFLMDVARGSCGEPGVDVGSVLQL